MAAFGYPAPAPAIPASPAVVAAGAVDGGAAVTAPAVTTSAGVFREYGAFVFRLLRRLGVPDADLDDLTQEVFIIVHRSLDRYEERNQMRAWLYRICVREASRHRRKRPAPASNVDVDLLSQPSGSSPEEAVQASEARADFDRLLAVLDEDRRAVFVLYEVEELSMEEVATAVGCPVATAYSRLRSARQLVVAAAKRLEAHREHAESHAAGKGRSR
ncbi:MAG: sigma-70 family RNA polymerase sigma factor [Labilithrix sp.]|nr:sigma-70 family RNA polymerase sigma factor [Labilithrix sp.]